MCIRDRAEHLTTASARVIVADIDEARARMVAHALGGTAISVDDALAADCDVLAPCATARVVDETTVGRLGCLSLIHI